jgi:ferredoxin-NADP reductase
VSATRQRRWVTTTVIDVFDAADAVRRITLRFPEPVIEAIEGSHLDVEVHLGDRTEVRSYSVISRGEQDPHTVVLAVHSAPRSRGGSAYMHTLAPGMTLRATQPLTSFPFRHNTGDVRFLAGGIGVTALMAMADAVRVRSDTGQVDYHFTYVGRKRSAMAFVEELQTSHGDAFTAHSSEASGRFDIGTYLADCPASAVLYVCGPAGMLDAVRNGWASAGRAPGRLRYETFGTAGKFPTTEFVVRVPDQDLAVTVKENESILDALQAVGADMMYDCRRGECGLCQVDIRALSGTVDHRDVFFSARQQQANTRLCTCVTRIAATTDGSIPEVTLDLP